MGLLIYLKSFSPANTLLLMPYVCNVMATICLSILRVTPLNQHCIRKTAVLDTAFYLIQRHTDTRYPLWSLLARTNVNAGHVTTPRNNTKRTHHLACPLCGGQRWIRTETYFLKPFILKAFSTLSHRCPKEYYSLKS